MQNVIDCVSNRDILFVNGDINCKVGGLHIKEPNLVGKHSNIEGGNSDRGKTFVDFCNMWISPGKQVKNTINFICIRKPAMQFIRDAHVLSTPDMSDHRLVRCKMNFSFLCNKNESLVQVQQKHKICKQFGSKSVEYKLAKSICKKLSRINKQKHIDKIHLGINLLPSSMKYYIALKKLKNTNERNIKNCSIKSKSGEVITDRDKVILQWHDFTLHYIIVIVISFHQL